MRNPGVPAIHMPGSLPLTPTNPLLVCIGMNPGYFEDEANQPFIGKSGSLLRSVYLGGSGLPSIASIILTNVVRCTTAVGNPKNIHYKACAPYLDIDFRNLAEALIPSPPLYVLCLGADATREFYRLFSEPPPVVPGKKTKAPKVSLAEAFARQGNTCTTPLGPASTFATFHPAACLRNRNLLYAVGDHMELLHAHIAGQAPTPTKPTRVAPFYPPNPNP